VTLFEILTIVGVVAGVLGAFFAWRHYRDDPNTKGNPLVPFEPDDDEANGA
jgi:hypothetical protein